MVAIVENSPGLARSNSKMTAATAPSVSNTTATYVRIVGGYEKVGCFFDGVATTTATTTATNLSEKLLFTDPP
jgi:hypothetical protein